MKIIRIDIFKINIPMLHVVVVPIGMLSEANNIVLRIITSDGQQGWGEASPFAPISGDSQASNFAVARDFARLLLDKDPLAIDARMHELNSLTTGECSLRSAFDMALHDIKGQAAGLPLYRLLGGELRPLSTDFTIGLQDTVAETLERLEEGLSRGYREVKLKVGRPGLADVEHVAAVRSIAGPDVRIRIDSNQGWDYPTAVRNLNAMEEFQVEYAEQPLACWDYLNLKRLRDAVDIPICADESVFSDKDAFRLMGMGAVDYLNIKLGKSGGIASALRIDAIATAAGSKCMLGCFAESRLGLTAAAHLACARPNIAFLDLDSAPNLKLDPVEGGMRYDDKQGGGLILPSTPGLGATVCEAFLQDCEKYSVMA